MSDQEPEATPRQQAQVRRLLAEARHDETTPPEVAQRLDDVLAQLVAEGPRAIDPPPPPASATVVDLGARRRRLVTGLLGAAAAVVVLGVGVSQVADLGSGGDEDSSSSSDAGEAGGAADESLRGESGPESAPSRSAAASPDADEQVPARPPVVGSASFAADAARLRDRGGAPTSDGLVLDDAQLSRDALFVCDPTATGDGRVFGVLYDGTPAILAYRPPAGDTQIVELLQCGSGDVIRSTVLRVP